MLNAFHGSLFFQRRSVTKTLRIMNFMTILLLACCLQISANVNSQAVTLNVKKAPLEKVFREIREQTGYTFMYTETMLKGAKKVSLQVKNVSLQKALDICFAIQPFTYNIIEKTVVVQPRVTDVAPLATSDAAALPPVEIRGRVTDEQGDPLQNVSILIVGTQIGTVTNNEGYFMLTAPDNKNISLEVSNIGYLTKRVRIGTQTEINITLEQDISDLSNVVVVGYGSQKKATVTGAISTVSGEKLEQAPNINFTNSLVGRLPGLTGVTGSSEPGRDDSRLRIRGGNTLGDNSPLIVVDGVIGRNISRLNPSDVVSVTVLKDASAAIYGAQAANGVILVTTKRGKIGKPSVQINLNQGWTSPTVIPKMADAASYAQMINEVSLYRGSPLQFTDEDIQKYRDGSDPWSYPNTDWFAETFKKSAVQQAADISVTGGSEFLKYFLSFGTNFQDGIYKNSGTNYGQANFRGNFDVKISKDINLSLNLNGQKENRHYPTVATSTIWATTINGLPIITAYWPNGLPGPDTQLGKSPLQATDATGYDKEKRYTLQSNAKLDISIPWVKGLSLTGNASFDQLVINNKLWKRPWMLYSWDHVSYDQNNQPVMIGALAGYADPSLSQTMTDGDQISLNLLLKYQTSIADKHNLNFLAGTERITSNSENFSAFRRYFVSTALDQMFAGGDLLKDNGGTASLSARLNAFGRINYDYSNKYLVEFVWRYDGSYIFPVKRQFGFFPGVSLGWVVSKEDFWDNKLSSISYFKIRGSWGQTGNDRVSPYQYTGGYLLGASNGNYIFNQNVSVSTLSSSRTPNPQITWEVANQTNVGFDMEMFDGKLKFTADYFYYLRTNILAQRNASVPSTAGITLPLENIGKVSNQGFDFNVSYGDKISNDFTYEISLNGGYAKNKIVFWDEAPGVPEYQKSTGHPMGSTLNYQVIGIFKDQAALDKYPHFATARPGDLIFEDINNDGMIDGRDRKMDYRSDLPTFTGGLAIDLGYRNFYLSLVMQGAAGAVRSIYMESEGEGFNYLQQNVDGRWTPDNTDALKPRAYNRVSDYWRAGVAWNNTYYRKSNDYLRLRTIEFGYSFPAAAINKIGLNGLRVYFSGQNLVTLTGLKDFDPESNYVQVSGTAYPINKVSNFGLSVTF